MKVFYICLFFVGMFIFPGVALGQKLFPYDIFEKSIDEFPISETELLCREWEKVSNDSICKYLVQIKNEADYGKRGHSVNYEVFSRYAKGEDLYLFYKKTCPEDSLIEIFVCNWSYENHFPVTLKIYRSKKGVADIFFRSNGNQISIFYIEPFEAYGARREVYEIASFFPLIYPKGRTNGMEFFNSSIEIVDSMQEGMFKQSND